MREKIEMIIAELVSGSGLTPKEAINQILLLFNEEIQKENKKESEVVVCPVVEVEKTTEQDV